MTRILLIQERGQPVPDHAEDVRITVLELDPAEPAPPAGGRVAESMHRTDAIVLALSGGESAGGMIQTVQALLDTARAPTVLCCPRNLHSFPAGRDSLIALAGGATAAVHGFGIRAAELAVQAAVRLARPRPGF
jgi:tetrahydromethanopterin S-methyltransferase subunit B